MTKLSIESQAVYVPEKGSSQYVVQEGIFFEDMTELSKWYQAAYVPERGSSQHVVQEEIFFFWKMWLNSVNDTKLPTYLKGDQVNM